MALLEESEVNAGVQFIRDFGGMSAISLYFGQDGALVAGRTFVDATFEGNIIKRNGKWFLQGDAYSEWEDKYDFNKNQPGHQAATALEKAGLAKTYINRSKWRQPWEVELFYDATGRLKPKTKGWKFIKNCGYSIDWNHDVAVAF